MLNTMLAVVVTLAVVTVLVGGKFSPYLPVSPQCLKCICLLESKCKNIGCRMDVGSYSCGYYQIKEPYYIDCYKPGHGWKQCADDYTCSSQCVQNYMKRYVPGSGCPATCQTYAREHNGGPKGCKSNTTLVYWEKLKKIPGCEHMDDI